MSIHFEVAKIMCPKQILNFRDFWRYSNKINKIECSSIGREPRGRIFLTMHGSIKIKLNTANVKEYFLYFKVQEEVRPRAWNAWIEM